MLLILNEEDKPRTAEDIDRIVCAEIPDPINEPQLYHTVTTCMNHGHCGAKNRFARCMENGCCSKNYPKNFTPATIPENDGYPLYRRRDNGRFFMSNTGERIDNTHIVPYNKVLSTMFNCHINVEVCNSISAVKYLYKYIFKGNMFY